MMLQELLGIADVEKGQCREVLSLRLLGMNASNGKSVIMRLEELSQSLLGAALWDIADVNLHISFMRPSGREVDDCCWISG